MSVHELAKRARLSTAAIYNIETGRAQNPQARTIKALESALEEQFPKESKEELSQESAIRGLGQFIDFDPHDARNLPRVAGVYVF